MHPGLNEYAYTKSILHEDQQDWVSDPRGLTHNSLLVWPQKDWSHETVLVGTSGMSRSVCSEGKGLGLQVSIW